MPPRSSSRTPSLIDEKSPGDVNIVDGLSLYQAGEQVKQVFEVDKAPLNYSVLFRVLVSLRSQNGYRTAQHSTLPISYDPRSDAQIRFLAAIERTDFEPDAVDYRELYASLPPGLSPRDSDDRPLATFASRLSYVLGRLSRYSDPSPHILIVSHSFELLWPLQSLKAANSQAKIGIAYFERFRDYRWQYANLAECGIDFFPLDSYIPELFGVESEGSDFYRSQQFGRREATGLNKF